MPFVSKVFEDLEVGASLWQEGQWPFAIHEEPSVQSFELVQGVLSARQEYNERCLNRVRRTGTSFLGHHAGCADLFVPVRVAGRVQAFIVTGPFATARPTSADVLSRWQVLTGRQGRLADPDFSHYVAATLSTLVLDAKRVAAFQRVVESLASLLASRGCPDEIRAEVESLRDELSGARFVERVWRAARAIVDERTTRLWSSPYNHVQLVALGLPRFPEHVAAGLFVSQRSDADPVDDLLRRDAFQRALVDHGRAAGNTMIGALGDHDVVFLSAASGSPERARRALVKIAGEASSVARRRFGLVLHVGVSAVAAPVPEQCQIALAAAETALARGVPMLLSGGESGVRRPLGGLRRELARLVEERPEALPARFDAFLEAAARRSAHRLEPTRAHVEAAFERMMEKLLESGTIEARGLETLEATVDREADRAGTVAELFAVYRRAARDIADAVQRPLAARRDRSLRRAEDHLRHHYAEPLRLGEVARIAGFAPKYFSALFHSSRGMTFADYVRKLRLERAKQLLSDTSLTQGRVAELSGFATRQYLSRVFRRRVGRTPAQYRLRSRGERGRRRP